MTDDEWNQMAQNAPGSLAVQLGKAGAALRELLRRVAWFWLELLRLDRLFKLDRPL